MQFIDGAKTTPSAVELLVKTLTAIEQIKPLADIEPSRFGHVHGPVMLFAGSEKLGTNSLVVLQRDGSLALVNHSAREKAYTVRPITAQRFVHIVIVAHGDDMDAATDHLLDALYFTTVGHPNRPYLMSYLAGLFGRQIPSREIEAS